MTQRSVLIIGGHSDIGLATAYAYAAAGYDVQLALRNAEKLQAEKSNLELRHNIAASLHELDILDSSRYEEFIDALPALPDVVVCAVGLLGDQQSSQDDSTCATLVMRSNFEGPANILGALGNRFAERGNGVLVGISSVAGERGRASNYVYGSAKAGFTAYLSGLRNRLAGHGVHVVTVKPGFVDTKMVSHIDLPKALTASSEQVAHAIVNASESKKNTVYIKKSWALIMAVIRLVPEGIFKKIKI